MPVDLVAFFLPMVLVISAIASMVRSRHRKRWRCATAISTALLVAIYFAPGWCLLVRARRGDSEAMYQLGVYYWTRLGYMATDIESRDFWWVEAAKRGHPRAIEQVQHFSRFGSSRYIPRRPKPLVEAAPTRLPVEAGSPFLLPGGPTVPWERKTR